MRCIGHPGMWRSKVVVAWLALIVLVGAASGTAAADNGNSENAHLCQQGGWKDLVTSDGQTFKNTGQCVSYAARGGTLTPANPYPEARALCEAMGGSFGVGGPDLVGSPNKGTVLWVCNDLPSLFPQGSELFSLCFATTDGSEVVQHNLDGPPIHVTCAMSAITSP